MRTVRILARFVPVLIAFLSVVGFSQQSSPQKPATSQKPAPGQPAPVPPSSTATSAQTPAERFPGFDINALDRTMDPCTNFYAFACGNWMAKNPIPPDQASWGRFNDLHERNQAILRTILEKYSADDPKRSPVEQK